MRDKTHHQQSSLVTALDNIMVIVHAYEFQSALDNEASKVLSERHKLEYTNLTTNWTERQTRPVLCIMPASSVIKRCFAFDENPGLFETSIDTSEDPYYRSVHLLWPHQSCSMIARSEVLAT